MRRFLITSNKFSGTAELFYNEQDHLAAIDMRQAIMPADVKAAFKRAVPVCLTDLSKSFTEGTTIVEADFVVSFKQFYDEYPLKRNRFKAEQLFEKMSKTEQVKAYYSLKEYNQYCKRNSWYTPMIADKYLRNKEYETEWRTL